MQLPPNAPAASLIGIKPLAPEHSRNFSAGIVVLPAPDVSLTVDAYQIAVRDRVVGSGTLYGTYAGVVRSNAVNEAIVANGNVLENVPFTGINVFTNGIDTRTRGIDVALNFGTGSRPHRLVAGGQLRENQSHPRARYARATRGFGTELVRSGRDLDA